MKKHFIQYVPFVIAFILALIHVIQVLTATSYLDENGNLVYYSTIDSVKYALIGIMLTFVLIILQNDRWKYIFLLLTVLSLTGLIQFSNRTIYLIIGGINIEIISFSLLILHILLNSEILPKIGLKLQPSEKTLAKRVEQEKQDFERGINQFKRKFAAKSNGELETIVQEKALVPEAVEAAKRLLTEQIKQ